MSMFSLFSLSKVAVSKINQLEDQLQAALARERELRDYLEDRTWEYDCRNEVNYCQCCRGGQCEGPGGYGLHHDLGCPLKKCIEDSKKANPDEEFK